MNSLDVDVTAIRPVLNGMSGNDLLFGEPLLPGGESTISLPFSGSDHCVELDLRAFLADPLLCDISGGPVETHQLATTITLCGGEVVEWTISETTTCFVPTEPGDDEGEGEGEEPMGVLIGQDDGNDAIVRVVNVSEESIIEIRVMPENQIGFGPNLLSGSIPPGETVTVVADLGPESSFFPGCPFLSFSWSVQIAGDAGLQCIGEMNSTACFGDVYTWFWDSETCSENEATSIR